MVKKFSVVIPIHNEEKMLPYSLPSIYALNPSEIVLVFDRCEDNSELIAKKWSKLSTTVFLQASENSSYHSRLAYVRRLGIETASNDVILTCDADMILDPKILHYVKLLNSRVGIIVFDFQDYPISYQNIIMKVVRKFVGRLFKQFRGIQLFSKTALLKTEDLEELRKLKRGEDAYRQVCITRKYRSVFVSTKSYHLRPTETHERHYLKGRLYWNVVKRGFLIVFLSSILLLRPKQLVGYIHERYK